MTSSNGSGMTDPKGGGMTSSTNPQACWQCDKRGHMKRNCWQNPDRAPEEAKAAQEEMHFALMAAEKRKDSAGTHDWVLDSGCSKHMTSNKDYFTSLAKHQGQVRIPNNRLLTIQGMGTIEVTLNGTNVTVKDVLYVPDLGYNLLSNSQLDKKGFVSIIGGGKATLTRQGLVIATAKLVGAVYVFYGDNAVNKRIQVAFPVAEEATSSADTKEEEVPKEQADANALWHKHLGHFSSGKANELIKAVDGVPFLKGVPMTIVTRAR